MPKLRELIQTPPEPEGGAEEQLEALRDYLRKVTQELEYLLTHLEADNINDTTFERISEMIPRPYTGLPLMDGEGSAGTSAAWSRGNHRHPHDDSKADVTALENHKADKANPHEVTKAHVGLGNVANERQYSAQNPPPTPTPGEVGAVPVTRKINGHALSADVTLDHTDVGAIPATDKGSAGGVAELDSNGLVPSAQLPSYVDDVKDYPTLADFPAIGEEGKIYVAKDTNRQYRWSGSDYVEISKSLALGETSSTAYRGDRGKTAYDHSQTTGNPHGTTAAEVGARPDTWTPSAADVGARPDTWTPTAADVGARPDTWTPSAADVGALAEDGTALSSYTLFPTKVYPGSLAAGWYKFAEVKITTTTGRAKITFKYGAANASFDFIGDIFVYKTNSTTMNCTMQIPYLVAGKTTYFRYNIDSATTVSLYVYKHDSSGVPAFTIITSGDISGNYLDPSTYMLETLVAETPPATALTPYYSAINRWIYNVPISPGTNQQILSYSNNRITSATVLAKIEFANPEYITTSYTWATTDGTNPGDDGTITLTGTCTTATTANLLLLNVV